MPEAPLTCRRVLSGRAGRFVSVGVAVLVVLVLPTAGIGSGSAAVVGSRVPSHLHVGRAEFAAAATLPVSPAAASGREARAAIPEGAASSTARLSAPVLRLRNAVVVPHRGAPDDATGTAIQDRGLLAMPLGARGGVLPGRVGNTIVTGHRTSAARTFLALPSMRAGAQVAVAYGRDVYVYRITGYLYVDVTKPSEVAAMTAPVPGRPGVAPTRSMLTLVTCATIEDNARGDRWRDAHGNPRHRIVRYGVLVRHVRV